MDEILRQLVEGGLIPNGITFITQLIATFVLFLILKKLVWLPMQEFLEKRKEVIVGELISAKAAREESEQLKTKYQLELKNAQHEASLIMDNAKYQAIETKNQIINEAEKEARYKLEKANKEIELEKTRVEKELKAHVIDLALTAAEKLVNENIDENKNRQLIEKFIEEVGE